MYRGDVYGQTLAMQGSPWTLVVYRHEFGGNLMEDIVEAYGPDDGTGTPDLAVLMQVAWAMARTYDDGFPAFPDWVRSLDPRDFALGDAETLGVIDSAIAAELFRRCKAGRIRRFVSRLMVRVADAARSFADRILHR